MTINSMRAGVFFLAGFIAVAVSAAVTHAEERASPVGSVATADGYPQGCIDCHLNMPDIGVDARLSTALEMWIQGVPVELMSTARRAMTGSGTLAGKHPRVIESLQDIPYACMGCHDAYAAEAPAFAPLMHLIHLTGGDESHFLTLFQGECTHCHKLDAQTGQWRLPSGPEK